MVTPKLFRINFVYSATIIYFYNGSVYGQMKAMSSKRREAALVYTAGISFLGLFATGCGNFQKSETSISATPQKTPGTAGADKTVDSVPSTTTTYPPTTIYMVEPPRAMTEAEQVENSLIIANEIRPALENMAVPVVEPINQDQAEVTAGNEFILEADAAGNCGAILSVSTLEIVEDGKTKPTNSRRLGVKFIGKLSIVADGNSYTASNFNSTYATLVHDDPGFYINRNNEFEPGNPASVQSALINMRDVVTSACSYEVPPTSP